LAGFVHADQRFGFRDRFRIDIQHIFHLRGESGMVPLRNASAFFLPGLEFVFLRDCFEIALSGESGYGSLVKNLAIQGRSRSRVEVEVSQRSLGSAMAKCKKVCAASLTPRPQANLSAASVRRDQVCRADGVPVADASGKLSELEHDLRRVSAGETGGHLGAD